MVRSNARRHANLRRDVDFVRRAEFGQHAAEVRFRCPSPYPAAVSNQLMPDLDRPGTVASCASRIVAGHQPDTGPAPNATADTRNPCAERAIDHVAPPLIERADDGAVVAVAQSRVHEFASRHSWS